MLQTQFNSALKSRGKGLIVIGFLISFVLFAGQVWAKQSGSEATAPMGLLNATLTGSQMAVGATGTTHHHSHLLTNTGTRPENFHLAVTGRQNWSISVSPSQVQLAPGQSISVTTALTIPNETPPGTMGIITLTVNNTPPAPPILLYVQDSLLVTGNNALKIPPAYWGTLIDGQRFYSITAMSGTTEFLPGLQTPTNGYDGSFLGPTLVMTKGEVISISVRNNLTDVTTVHWHGLHLPGKMDGGPHQAIDPGTTWRPTFTMINEASTPWYHPHPHGDEHDHGQRSLSAINATTGKQVYSGLAGMIFIRDNASNALGLPQTYGVDEFPIVVQDRNFNADGTMREYPILQDRDLHKGNFFLINGTLAPTLNAPAQIVRLHLLNGSNARFYNFGFADNRSFYQIASDNALLNQPVQRNRVVMGPGERVEIVVDLSQDQGETLYFANYGEELITPLTSVDDFDEANLILFSIQVVAPTANKVTSLPAKLNEIVRLDKSSVILTRTLLLNIPPSINLRTFQMDFINITSTLDSQEVWTIINQSEEPHPMHIHDSPFQILTRNGAPPPDYEQGWKDTLIVQPLEKVELIKDFSGFADATGPFMYHCHILDHEDKGMMGQFIITEKKSNYLPVIIR